jgi:capsid protein
VSEGEQGQETARRRPLADPFAMASGASELVPQSFFSGYSGANVSERRGQIYWPTLDTREELTAFSREELLRRCRWLVGNSGFVRGFVMNAAKLVGRWRPTMETGAAEWDAAVNENFRARAGSKVVFDAGGRYTFFTAQGMLMRKALGDGDLLTVYTEGPSRGARVAFYEAHQLKSPKESRMDRWRDGVLTNGMNAALAYGLSRGDRRGDGTAVQRVGARDAYLFGMHDAPGHVRPVPPLAHAVNHGVDVVEVWGDVKHAIKTAGVVSMYRERELGAKGRSAGLVGAARQEEQTSTNQKYEVQDVWRGGQAQELEPGERVKILHDERPHPNQREFVQDLIRDMSVGFGLPPEVVWQMANLTGPGVRFVMDLASCWVREWREELLMWCHRYYVYHIAKEIKAGRLEPAPERVGERPLGWRWMQSVNWTATRDLTIDRGKDGRERREQIHDGLGTKEDFYEDFEGKGHKEVTRKRIQEVRFEMDECVRQGVPYEVAFPPRQGAAKQQDEKTTEPPEGEEEED